MKPPFFSIITCTRNSEKYLAECIKSVETQTFKDYEHVFIDAFSKDKTISIIEKYRKKHPKKVKLLQSKPKGIANAMNKGIRTSRGVFLCHLHSDDYFYSAKTLKIVHDIYKKTKSPWIVGASAKKYEKQNKLIISPKISRLKQKMLFAEDYISHQNAFVKKDLFKKYGLFDETFRICMDYEFWLRLLKNKEKPLFINENLSVFRVHSESLSASHNHMIEILKEDFYARKKNTSYYLIYEILSLANKVLRNIYKKPNNSY